MVNSFDDDAIDRAIDDVAGAMSRGEPSADFRARVVGRISEVPGSRFPVPGSRVWVLGAAAAALVIAIVMISRDERPASVAHTQAADPSAGPNRLRQGYGGQEGPALRAADGGPAPGERDRAPDLGRPGPFGPGAPRRTRRLVADDTAASPVAALAPPPLAVDPLDPRAIDPLDSIHLQELAVAPIGVTPLPVIDPLSEGEIR